MRSELAKDSWSNFRMALIEKDREVFDEMANKARLHADATMDAAFPDPLEGVLLSILLKNEEELRRLKLR